VPTRAAENSDDDKLIWGAKAIGEYLGLDPRQTFYQLEAGRIEGARKWGRKWSAPGRILRRIATGEAPSIDA
jgi:hypothetical protein